jgi:hypothetical protein
MLPVISIGEFVCIAYMMLWYDSTETLGYASLYDLYDGILH